VSSLLAAAMYACNVQVPALSACSATFLNTSLPPNHTHPPSPPPAPPAPPGCFPTTCHAAGCRSGWMPRSCT
jgi:hypothetical protein